MLLLRLLSGPRVVPADNQVLSGGSAQHADIAGPPRPPRQVVHAHFEKGPSRYLSCQDGARGHPADPGETACYAGSFVGQVLAVDNIMKY